MTTSTMRSAVAPDTQAARATGGDYLRQFAVIVVTLGTIAINILANALPINGIPTGEVSDKYPTLFTPAGYVFAIWGVIYIGMIAYMIYQALPSQRTNPRLRATGWWYVLGNLANAGWLFLWHYELLLPSTGLIAVLLIALIIAWLHLARARQVPGLVSRGEWWTTHLPFSIYTAWVTVATIANITIYLVSIGFDGGPLSPAMWSAILLLVATGIGLTILRRWGDVAYVAVFIWSFIGIAVKQSDTPLVLWTAVALAVVLAVAAAVASVRTRRA